MIERMNVVRLLFLSGIAVLPALGFGQAAPMRVACLGDGIAAGVGLPDPSRDAWPAQLGLLLGPTWDTRNFSTSNTTVLRAGDFPVWTRPSFAAALAFLPERVFVVLGTNDSKPWNWEHGSEFVGDYTALVDTITGLQSVPQVFTCRPTPVFWDQDGISESVSGRR